MSKDKSDKKERKEKKEKRSEDGVKKPKKDKKSKLSTENIAAAYEEAVNAPTVEVVAEDAMVIEKSEGGGVVPKPVGALVPFANPLADEKVAKKVLKSVKKGNSPSVPPNSSQRGHLS